MCIRDSNGGYYDAEIVSDLLNLKCVTDVTEEKQVVSVETVSYTHLEVIVAAVTAAAVTTANL